MPVAAISLLIFLLGGALAWVLAVALFAHGLARPPRMTDGKAVYLLGRISPADLGMEFADLKFQIGQSVALAAWWIPCEKSEKTVVMLHGFADAKIGVIAWARRGEDGLQHSRSRSSRPRREWRKALHGRTSGAVGHPVAARATSRTVSTANATGRGALRRKPGCGRRGARGSPEPGRLGSSSRTAHSPHIALQ